MNHKSYNKSTRRQHQHSGSNTSSRRSSPKRERSYERSVLRVSPRDHAYRENRHRSPNARGKQLESKFRKVRLGTKVDDYENDRNTSKYYHKDVSSPKRSIFGVKDARELLSKRETTPDDSNMVKKLEEQIKINEIEARRLARQARHAKRNLDEYLHLTIRKDSSENNRRSDIDSRQRRRYVSELERAPKRKNGESSRDRIQSEYKGKRQRSNDVSTSKRSHKRHSRKHHPYNSKSSSSSRHNSSEEHTIEPNPKRWTLLRPSDVEDFNCSGPAIFAQNITESTRRRDVYKYFKNYGTIVDIQLLDVKKQKTACVIFSRQSEAEKAFDEHNVGTSEQAEIVNIVNPIKENRFDLLLSALRQSEVN